MPGEQGQPGNCPPSLSRVFSGVMLGLDERIGGEEEERAREFFLLF